MLRLIFILLFAHLDLYCVEKSMVFGFGSKLYENDNIIIHKARYIQGGYYYQFGDKYLNKFQFNVSNSSKEIELKIPYVTASTAFNVTYDFNFNIINNKSIKFYLGGYLSDNLILNFFPEVDKNDFDVINQSLMGISINNNFMLDNDISICLNLYLPVYHLTISNKVDRFIFENDGVENNVSEGFYKKINFNSEIGLKSNKYNLGIFYLLNYNKIINTKIGDLNEITNSLNIRIFI